MDSQEKILKYLENIEKDVKFIEEQIKNNPNDIEKYEEQLYSLLEGIGSTLSEVKIDETTE